MAAQARSTAVIGSAETLRSRARGLVASVQVQVDLHRGADPLRLGACEVLAAAASTRDGLGQHAPRTLIAFDLREALGRLLGAI